MVGLARAIYNPRPGELAGALRDPAELCNPDLTDRAAVETLLFDAFIPAAYRHDPAGRWKARAQRSGSSSSPAISNERSPPGPGLVAATGRRTGIRIRGGGRG